MEKEWKSGEAIWHMKQAERNALDVAAMNKLNEIVDVAALRQRVAELERGLDSAYQLADHYRDERDALKQQRDELLAAQQWQPIETAPKDKEVFIGAFIDGEFHFGKAVCFYEHGNEFEGEFYSGWYWSIDDVSESVAENPTHWMPLPPAPAIASVKEK